jgi:hypothetical protein
MLQGYSDQPSLTSGSTLRIHVGDPAGPRGFIAQFFRVGAKVDYVGASAQFASNAVPMGSPNSNWGWPSYDIPIPGAWKPGVYIALLIAQPTSANPRAYSAKFVLTSPESLLFVLRAAAPGQNACIVYKLPLFTYQAYNDLGTPLGSLYTGGFSTVTLQRPGGGTGGHAWDSIYVDAYDGSSSRQVFAHWDAPFIQWLESSGYAVDYCTDLDLHRDGNGDFLSRYRLLLSVGHDEYWSPELRNNVKTFIAAGGNVAFLSGNVCWWRVHVDAAGTSMTCNKDATSSAFDQWFATAPENQLTGVSYRNAGGWWNGPRQLLGYTVQFHNHWVYRGTGLADGSVFGAPQALVGYECDGAKLSTTPGPSGYELPSYDDGTPSTFLPLGIAHFAPGWEDAEAGPASVATLGLYTRNGTVFTAATTDWARVVASGEPTVVQITRNVLDSLSSKSIRIHGLSTDTCGPSAVEGNTFVLFVDTSSLSTVNGLTFHWTSTCASGPTDQPTITLTLPSPPVPVSVTVTVNDGTGCPAFGTLTFTPVTMQDAMRLELLCQLRNFAVGSETHNRLLQGVRDRVPGFVDPLYDPLRGELTQRVFTESRQIKVGIAQLTRMLRLLESMDLRINAPGESLRPDVAIARDSPAISSPQSEDANNRAKFGPE